MTDTKALNSNRYKQLRTKVLLTFFIVSSLLIVAMAYYHYDQRTKVLYTTSIEKLLILTKTVRNIEKNQLKLYNARFKKIQSNQELLSVIQAKNRDKIHTLVDATFSFFKEASPSLRNLHIYDLDKTPLLHPKKSLKHNKVLAEAMCHNSQKKGYVVAVYGYYSSLVYPLKNNQKTIAYLEFEIEADNIFRLSSKAGHYKYALYLRDFNNSNNIGHLVATNSKMFHELELNREFLNKYANAEKLFQYKEQYFLFQQYDVETPFQKNFAQVVMAYNTTAFVKENQKTGIYSLELSLALLLFLLTIIYFFATKIINKLALEEQELEQKHKQIEIIMNTSDNLIILLDHGKIKLMNDTFLPFTHFESIDSIIEKQPNLSEFFIENEHTFTPYSVTSNLTWIKELNGVEDSKKIVAMNHKEFGINYFSIKIKKPQGSKDSYIVIFSNISSIYKKSIQDNYMAYHDTLTKIYNREFFNEAIAQNIYEAHKSPFSSTLLMLDLDFFKNVNDTHGHQVGDEVLIKFSQIISHNVREGDIFARWGGEEFVVLLVNTSQKTALKVAKHLREKIESASFGEAGSITCSIGISEYSRYETIEEWVEKVDQALYKAKENGRNRVEVL